MSSYQPTFREAVEQASSVERMVARAARFYAIGWEEERYHSGPKPINADGFRVQFKRGRIWYSVRWPMSRIERRCDDCGAVLRASRDCGGHGFYYDARWLTGNPALADPRNTEPYRPRNACLGCLNRVRARLRLSEEINEARLVIGRIKREAGRAKAD